MEEKLIHPINDDKALEPVRFIRDAPPAHYRLKIESFSLLSNLLSKFGIDKYESGNFEIGGFKWRLSLYPDGDENKIGGGHISLYLALAEAENITLGSEFHVFFKLFVYDQIRDKYLIVQDANQKGRRFNALKSEWGFSQLLPLTTFNDSANGYLVNDCSIFGAEVFVMNSTGKGEKFSVIKEPKNSSLTWKICNFSGLNGHFINSEVVTVEGHKWYLKLHPKGDSRVKEKSLSLFLVLEDCSTLHPGQNIYVEFNLKIKNQVDGNHYVLTGNSIFSSSYWEWGFSEYMPLRDFKDKSKGFIVDDTVIVEGQINLLSVVKYFS